jgi:tryptophanyl-tRNA synthetase
VAEEVIAYLGPVRERYHEIRGTPQALEATLLSGAVKAREIASQTLNEVRHRMGVGPA